MFAGIREVLHADFPPGSHDYPMRAHDTWTLLLIDQGAVRYHLEGRERIAWPGASPRGGERRHRRYCDARSSGV